MKRLWWGIIAVAVIALGIIMGSVVNLRSTPEAPGTLTIQEVLLGTPVSPPANGASWNAASKLTQPRNYETTTPLAVRIVSSAPAEQQFSVGARLLKEDGSIEPLSPSSITIHGGTSGYCCWTVAKPGEYKLQIFTGSQAPFILPLKVVPAQKNQSPLKIR